MTMGVGDPAECSASDKARGGHKVEGFRSAQGELQNLQDYGNEFCISSGDARDQLCLETGKDGRNVICID